MRPSLEMSETETVIRLQVLQQQMSERLIARYREQAQDEREWERNVCASAADKA